MSAVFHSLLPLFIQLFQAFVRQLTETYLSLEVELLEKRRFRGFSGCVGAIDGTLLNLFLPERQRTQQRWRSRHGAIQ